VNIRTTGFSQRVNNFIFMSQGLKFMYRIPPCGFPKIFYGIHDPLYSEFNFLSQVLDMSKDLAGIKIQFTISGIGIPNPKNVRNSLVCSCEHLKANYRNHPRNNLFITLMRYRTYVSCFRKRKYF